SDHLPPTLFLRCCGQLAHVHMFHPADLGRLAANFKITQAGSITEKHFACRHGRACPGIPIGRAPRFSTSRSPAQGR
ncbi:hypothetical protein J4G37_02060, partial [Microvirga sp. 3-52]|nr:hypothetical protein [Microvirga sp. 3-52]